MNVVALIGNLATDVEVKELGEDRKVASFLLAVDRPSQDGGADFVRVATWNKQAESCERFLSKGSHVSIDGRLRSRSWKDDAGNRREAIEVVANRVGFLSQNGQKQEVGDEIPFETAVRR